MAGPAPDERYGWRRHGRMVVAIIDNAQTNLLALSVTIVPARASDLVTRRHICGACCSCRSRFQAACCVSLSSTVLIAPWSSPLSRGKPSVVRQQARANKPSTGISSGKLIRARTPIPPQQATMAGVPNVASLSQSHPHFSIPCTLRLTQWVTIYPTEQQGRR